MFSNNSYITKNNIRKKLLENEEEYDKEYLLTITNYLKIRMDNFENILFKAIVSEMDMLKKKKYPNIQTLKNATVIYNKLKDNINDKFYQEVYPIQNLEITNSEYKFESKSNPFKLLQNDLMIPENYTKDLEGKMCKKMRGLLCFIISHETKTRKEFSINIVMDNRVYFDKEESFNLNNYVLTDITELLECKNKNLVKEIIKYTKELKLKKETYLKTFKKYIPSNLFFGFLATLTFNKNDEEDVYDVLDLLYYQNTEKLPFLNLYYEIYILDKNTKHFIYTDVNTVDIKDYKNILIQNSSVLYYNDLEKCLVFDNNRIKLIVKNLYTTTLKKNNSSLDTDDENRLIFNFTKNGNKLQVLAHAKEIYYNNIDYNNKVYLQGNKILDKNVLHKKNLLHSNVIYKEIEKKYFLSKHFILGKNGTSETDNLLTLLYKINHMTLPWNVLWKFVKETKFKDCEFFEHESCILLFNEFSLQYKEEFDEIITDLTNISFTKIFESVFNNSKNKSLAVDFIKNNIKYDGKKLITTANKSQKDFNDYIEILNLILHFV